jgi:hypothetical protein
MRRNVSFLQFGILFTLLFVFCNPVFSQGVIRLSSSSKGIFTHPPTDLNNVSGVVPLGNLNPGGGHVLAVDHMYILYPHPESGGVYSYPVFAMADGEIVMLTRQKYPDRPDFDYQVYILHNRTVTSYFDHLHGLSDRIQQHLNTVPNPWLNLVSDGFEFILLGQLGAPSALDVSAGEQVGITKSYSGSWDIGTIDTRVRGRFAGKGIRRYPSLKDYLDLLGYPEVSPPFPGHSTLNAVPFINYMTSDLKAEWFNLLISNPKDCGRADWDINGRLRGAWFNPVVDKSAEPPLFELEFAALSIIPDNKAPTTRLQVGVGSGNPLAALDPGGIYPQLRNPFSIEMNTIAGKRVNPDPAGVRIKSGTVCYDLAYRGNSGELRYNTIQFHMLSSKQVAIKFDPTPYNVPHCSLMTLSEPDNTWIIYKR